MTDLEDISDSVMEVGDQWELQCMSLARCSCVVAQMKNAILEAIDLDCKQSNLIQTENTCLLAST